MVIVPGDPENSLLVRAVRFTDPDLRMPPEKDGGKLSEAQIHALESWVAMGAPWGETVPVVGVGGRDYRVGPSPEERAPFKATLARFVREPIPRHGGQNDMERLVCRPTVCHRVGQRFDHL